MIVPSAGYEHKYPLDCYRYYPDGLIASAKYVGLEVLETYTQWDKEKYPDMDDIWKDSVLITRRPKKSLINDTKFFIKSNLIKLASYSARYQNTVSCEYNSDIEQKQQKKKLRSCLYYAINQQVFDEENKIYAESIIEKNGYFSLKFELCHLGEVALRFDPCECACLIKQLEVFINGTLCNYSAYNATKQENNEFIFETSDPIIFLQPENFVAIKVITVSGYIKNIFGGDLF